MSKKLTPWFQDFTKPFRIGYYEVIWLFGFSEPHVYYWDGVFWCADDESEPCGLQCFYWRGLAKKP